MINGRIAEFFDERAGRGFGFLQHAADHRQTAGAVGTDGVHINFKIAGDRTTTGPLSTA